MKKVLAIVLSALLLVAALVGCASKSEPASNDNNASADTAASTDGKLETLRSALPPPRTPRSSSRSRTRWLPRAMTSRS